MLILCLSLLLTPVFLGEYSVSCADIAAALGRITTALVSASDRQAVHFYLARLVYLDAVGSVDFMNIDHAGLQILINAMNSFWNAIESRNDQFVQDALKFPLKNKFSRNELQGERRKANLAELRTTINNLKKSNRYIGPIVIGMASETFYSNVSVFDHFYRSIFNAVSIPNHQPINNLGLMLCAEGFLFGMDIQSTLKSSLLHLGAGGAGKVDAEWENRTRDAIVQRLCTSLEIRALVSNATKSLKLYHLSRLAVLTSNKVARFRVELQCFCAVLWERVVMFAYEARLDLVALRNELFIPFYKKLEMISSPEEILGFDGGIGPNELAVNEVLNITLIKASHNSGLVCNHEYIARCALLWGMITNPSSSVILMAGQAAAGKTAIRDTVLNAIRTLGTAVDAFFSESWPVKCRRSAYVILARLRQWKDYQQRLREERRQREQEALLRATELELEQQLERQKAPLRQDQTEDGADSSNPSKPGSAGGVDGAGVSRRSSNQPHGMYAIDEHASRDDYNQDYGYGFAENRKASIAISMPLALTGLRPIDASGSTKVTAASASAAAQAASKQPRMFGGPGPKQQVDVSVIYHASLSASHLLGHYDSNGRWLDGILLRKIRNVDEKNKRHAKAQASEIGANSSASHSSTPMTVIVLTGPIGYYIEQIFSATTYLTSSSAVPSSVHSRTLLLPSAELHQLGPDVKILIETNDIANASPSFFVSVPMLKVDICSTVCVTRLLTLWVRSLIHWLGDFPPWLDTMDFIVDLLLKKDFVQDLLAADSSAALTPAQDSDARSIPSAASANAAAVAALPVVVIVSRISAFLRILEDLLLQTHQLALVDASFVIPEDKEDSDSSDSDRECGFEPGGYRECCFFESLEFPSAITVETAYTRT